MNFNIRHTGSNNSLSGPTALLDVSLVELGQDKQGGWEGVVLHLSTQFETNRSVLALATFK